MIVQYGQKEFDENWLQLVSYDPVHPELCICKRIIGNRTMFVFTYNKVSQVVIYARIGNSIPHNMAEVLEDDEYTSKYDIRYAVFYSVFRLPEASIKGAGTLAINQLIAYCRSQRVNNFYTLSPIPSLKDHFKNKPRNSVVRKYLESGQDPVAKFHLSNGGRIHRINFEADCSELRLKESWGIMVNYDYNSEV